MRTCSLSSIKEERLQCLMSSPTLLYCIDHTSSSALRPGMIVHKTTPDIDRTSGVGRSIRVLCMVIVAREANVRNTSSSADAFVNPLPYL